jgi:hypothetical protein
MEERKKLRGGKNKHSYANVLSFRNKSNRNA